jgi:hypothetical protein
MRTLVKRKLISENFREFENKVVRRVFGCTKEKVTGRLRKLRNKELYNLYHSPNITRMIKLKEKETAEHVARK